MEQFPWELLGTIIVAILGSTWFANLVVNRKTSIGEVIQMIKELKDDIERRDAINSRIRILRCNDEILRGQLHSKEYFDQTLADIDEYQQYCSNHPEFVNNRTKMSVQNIMQTYEKCLHEGTFL